MRAILAGVLAGFLMRDKELIETFLVTLVIYWVLGFVFD